MLNNNKLVTLGKEMLNGLSHLRTLKLADNALSCDCHLAWLSRHLRTYPRLGQHTRCASPAHLKDRNLADLQVSLTARSRIIIIVVSSLRNPRALHVYTDSLITAIT
jgi:hypothetical protein